VKTIDALEQAIVQRYGRLTQVPAGLRLWHDNGSIFPARLFVGATQQLAITPEVFPRYSPEYNGAIEHFFSDPGERLQKGIRTGTLCAAVYKNFLVSIDDLCPGVIP